MSVEQDATRARALVWDGSELGVEPALGVRAPREFEVEVSISTAGLCHSDLSPIEGRIPVETPIVLGHEAVGTVSAVGEHVDVPIGQRVVLTTLRRCGRCAQCTAGRPGRCLASTAPSESPYSRDGVGVHQFVRLGAFAERIVVGADQIIPVPDELSDPIAAMLCCATVTAFGAVEDRARLQSGETALVTGAGGIGLNAILAARCAGAARIVVVDANPAKERIARACGATEFIVPAEGSEVAAYVAEAAPEGIDVAFECTGNVGLLSTAVSSLAPGGRAVIVGLPPAGTDIALPVRALFHDKSLLGCRMGSVDPHVAVPRLAERVLSGEIDLQPLVSKIVPMEDTWELVQDLRAGRIDRGFIEFTTERDHGTGRRST